MKHLLLLLFIIPLLAIAQDVEKAIPYNSDFKGYIKVANQKDKVNKSLTNAVICVDTATGKQYAVSMDSIGGNTDTTSLSNRIDLKLNISDTLDMLSTYAHTWDAADVDTTEIATRARLHQATLDTSKIIRPLIYAKWGTSGNSVTFPNNKLGTTNNADIRIVANNILVFQGDSATGNVGLAGSAPSASYDVVCGNGGYYTTGEYNTTSAFYINGGSSAFNLRRLWFSNTSFGAGINDGIVLDGTNSANIYQARNVTANTEGKPLSMSSGGCTSGSTNKSAGANIYGRTSIATGLGGSRHEWYISKPSTSGTTDNIPVISMKLDSAEALKVNGYVNGKQVIGVLQDSTDQTTTLVTTGYTTHKTFRQKIALNCTTTDSTITVPIAGYYDIRFTCSFSYSANSKIIHNSIFSNDIETYLEMERKIGTAGDVGNSSMQGVVWLAANSVLKVKGITDGNGTMTRTHSQFTVKLLTN